ncbi:MAG TPA: ATP synthase F0 subunit A, partial [Flavobacterium sp.]
MVISNKPLRFLVAILVAFLPLFSTANPVADSAKANIEVAHKEETTHEGAHAEPTDVKSEIKEFINHHLLDAHDFTFSANKETGEHYGFSLPIILWDGGLQVFSSSEFHHGPAEGVAAHNGNFYKLHHEKIYKTDASGELTEEHGHPTNV